MEMETTSVNDLQTLRDFIERYFFIERVTEGKQADKWKVKYLGKLRFPDRSEWAFEEMENKAAQYNYSILLVEEQDKQAVYILDAFPDKKKSNPKINLFLFIITLISVLVTGGLFSSQGEMPDKFDLNALLLIAKNGWPFAVAIIVILGAHEMGHYIAGKKHGVDVTLPYFIPMPVISPFGTMGAFINMRSIPKNRKQLFDIAIAGPLAGIIIAIPVTLLGLYLSRIEPLPLKLPANIGLQMEGNSLLYLGLKYIVFGELLPQPMDYGGLNPILYWIRYFFTGQPSPLGGYDVMIHPVAWAGWAGILVTALNLVPIGQLDGGHILNAVFGQKVAQSLTPVFLFLMGILGFAWAGWWFWALLLIFLNRFPSQMRDSISKLDPTRKKWALLMLIVFILVFTPVPIVLLTG